MTLQPRTAYSDLQKERLKFQPPLPSIFSHAPTELQIVEKEALGAAADHDEVKAQFPNTYGKPRVELHPGKSADSVGAALRVGVVLSGGQAPGGHNVIAGLFDGIKSVNADSVLFGFLDGPKGIFTGKYIEITSQGLDCFRNTGGFDMICSGRDKIETPEQFVACKEVCEKLDLDGLVVIGGDDSNTNAAVLAEYFLAQGCKTRVCGCPKTIDGDLKNTYIPVSFGFDTACRVFSEQISNICADTLSSQKYWHFVRLMGRSASSIALECALQTRPNVCLIGEEVKEKKQGLISLSQELAKLIVDRHAVGRDYGVVLLPEGLIEFIPEFMELISEINDKLAAGAAADPNTISSALSPENAQLFDYLPSAIKSQLVLDRDPHGNVQVSLIETEKLLASTVAGELAKQDFKGKFDPQFAFCGYEGRSALPSPFDTTYTYVIGRTAAVLIANSLTGLMVSVTNLQSAVSEWNCGGVPITMMCCMEKRKGKFKPVIQKALVELTGERSNPYQAFAQRRDLWAMADAYRTVGPLQFGEDVELCRTLKYELCGICDNDEEGPEVLNEIAAATTTVGSFVFRPQPRQCLSKVCLERLSAPVTIPAKLAGGFLKEGEPTQCSRPRDGNIIRSIFPTLDKAPMVEIVAEATPETKETPKTAKRVGIVLCGRQAPATHNIIWGVAHALKTHCAESEVIGFTNGTKGFFAQSHVTITEELVASFRNQGGMHMLGRSVDRIRSKKELDAAAKTCQDFNLDGLILVGGAKTHTDAAYLAEYLAAQSVKTAVVCCPTSIGGEMMKGTFVHCMVGFDTHCHVNAEMIGNTATDGASNKKYYYFIRLNAGGHAPSHVVLEAALQTQPTITLLTEEIAKGHMSLRDIAGDIADIVAARSALGKNFGCVLVPEGLLTSIPEMRSLLDELDAIAGARDSGFTKETVLPLLTPWGRSLFLSLPEFAQDQLFHGRQSDGHADLDKVDTERLMAHFVDMELAKRKEAGQFKGKFAAITSIRSSQARSAVPTQFDCELGFAVGATAGLLALHGKNGYFVSITGLHNDASEWNIAGAPLTALLVADGAEFLENGTSIRPRVAPAAVRFESDGYATFAANRARWAVEECNENPGPVQFSGHTMNSRAKIVSLSRNNYIANLAEVWSLIEQVKTLCRPGCDRNAMHVAMKTLSTLNDMMQFAAHHDSGTVDGHVGRAKPLF